MSTLRAPKPSYRYKMTLPGRTGAKRTARGWERGLLGVPTVGYFIGAGLCTFLCVAMFMSARSPVETEPLTTVEGQLLLVREVFSPSHWVEIYLDARKERFCRPFAESSPALRTAIEQGIARGTPVRMRVSQRELAADAQNVSAGKKSYVEIVELSVADKLLASETERAEARRSNARAAFYGMFIAGFFALAFVWGGVRRFRLLGAHEDAAPNRSLSARVLALHAPFVLHRRAFTRARSMLLVAVLVVAPMAALPIGLALQGEQELQRREHIWRDGERGLAHVIMLRERSSEHDSSYHITLHVDQPISMQRDVQVHWEGGKFRAEGPLEVRWLKTDPSEVVLAGQIDQRQPLILHGVMLASGLLLAGLALYIAWKGREKIDALRSMARHGKIERAELLGLAVSGHAQNPMREVRYRVASGDERREDYSVGDPPPLMVDARHILVLATQDGRQHALIREDGFPLSLDA